MTGDSRPPRRPPRRRYPLRAYVPFSLLVAVPVILVIVIASMLTHAITSSPSRTTGHATPTAGHIAVGATAAAATPRTSASAATPLRTSPAPVTATTTTTATKAITPTPALPPLAPTITVGASQPVTIAIGATADGRPIGASTIFHGAHTRLWAFASVPSVSAGDTVHFIWRDLDRHSTIEDWPQPVQVNAARLSVRMYAFPGNNLVAGRPFAPGHYRVDVLRDATLVASRDFTVANS